MPFNNYTSMYFNGLLVKEIHVLSTFKQILNPVSPTKGVEINVATGEKFSFSSIRKHYGENFCVSWKYTHHLGLTHKHI